MVLCAASLLVRFRRAQGIERQQLKWFSYAIALFAPVFVAYSDHAAVGRMDFEHSL
jgi:hypothetical protein